MRLIIAGGRDYTFTRRDLRYLAALIDFFNHIRAPIKAVLTGRARGADWDGEMWAHCHDLPVFPFPADWELYGKPAGMIRNREMAEFADAVVLFPGGRGTQGMYDIAIEHGLLIIDLRYKKPRIINPHYG